MNKTELIEKVVANAGVSKKDATAVVVATFEEIADALAKGEKVQIIGFGTFEARQRAARVGKNPQTGEEVNIPASIAPAFKAGKALKDIVNK